METGVAGDTGVKEMTIEAIKEALDALEDLLYHDEEPDQRLGRAVYVLQEAVKEAEKQEPVAWMHKETGLLRREISKAADWYSNYWQPLYAAPRQWVGLTDEEKRQIVLDDPIDWVAAIEAKLKKKNETS
jgi:hypothetical protein